VQGKTHIITGIACGTLAAAHGYIEPTVLNALAITIACVLPDIDKRGTTVSKKVILPFHILFKHRGFTHSIVGGSLFIFMMNLYDENLWMPLVLGLLAHIIPDMLTSKGIKLFWPMQKSFKFPFTCSTGSTEEWIFSVMMGLIILLNLNMALGL
jgi:inner membrane protein